MSHYRSGAMRQFLQNATQLQLFKQVPRPPRGGWPVRTPGGDFCSCLTVSAEAVGIGDPGAPEGLGV